ncbi:hypothetical protein [Chryseobacterium defluvii]|uniref:Uncharacterized protein n=1 Tax=Chryseobacterium defluvii TaxID=160396 RepID=A0A495SLX8_9FLAO|nr:hypothetical protein [Chryseobacterium defluvii]RKT01096.1 hypothetical protein BCF58_0310 [Chryseobacterium defluvii]
MKSKTIYFIRFFEPVEGKTEYFFSTISSIFNRFDSTVIGYAKQTIYQKSLSVGESFGTKKCVIKKENMN